MEKGEIRKYIPFFLKLYSSVSAFLYSSRSNICKHISHDYHTQTSLLIPFCKADVITCLKQRTLKLVFPSSVLEYYTN